MAHHRRVWMLNSEGNQQKKRNKERKKEKKQIYIFTSWFIAVWVSALFDRSPIEAGAFDGWRRRRRRKKRQRWIKKQNKKIFLRVFDVSIWNSDKTARPKVLAAWVGSRAPGRRHSSGNGHPLIRRHHLNRNTCPLRWLSSGSSLKLISCFFIISFPFFSLLFFTLPISISNNLGHGRKEKNSPSLPICYYQSYSFCWCPATVKQKKCFFFFQRRQVKFRLGLRVETLYDKSTTISCSKNSKEKWMKKAFGRDKKKKKEVCWPNAAAP